MRQDAYAQRVESGSTIHLPLDQLQPIDLSLNPSVAPGQRERGQDSVLILHPAANKTTQFRDFVLYD